ncbi:52 kDa repressor of the inhibitor of the protein kinase-like [Aphis gossypii]|uniref:52 kDa repressor of the inhibitor of the protein kinase-like n=1 Tax=Aphis gossypii TaxID=80765 RepID=UPI002158A6D2|nr:52 kDa repressor of the inhibitor of the protein kinase-like [Aphis gossypii]
MFLLSKWCPSKEFEFPNDPKDKRNLRFQVQWLEQYSWLTYSVQENGALCTYCILFLHNQVGHSKLSTRGKKDYGKINTTMEDKSEGKFRALLKFRANSGDEILKDHLETGAANAQYTSAKTQNKLIEICGQVITEQIVNKINRASFFSVMADETTDIGKLEQMSLCVRYIDPDNEVPTIREDFLNFVVVSDLSGSGLASVILENLKNHGINLEKMVGQGYDGAAAMSGHLNGVQAIVRRTFPRALYVHCSAHSLNLAISDACKISAIRNCVGSVSSVCNFFRGSAQRTAVLKKCIQAQTTLSTNIKMTLVTMCETRWVLRHDCIKRFKEMFIPIVNALEHLEKSVNKETSTTAHQLLRVILNENVIDVLNKMRSNSDDEFNIIFEESHTTLDELGCDVSIPRCIKKQNNRNNVPSTSPQEYYKRSVFIPFLDHMTTHLSERFLNHKEVISSLETLLPNHISNTSKGPSGECLDLYSSVLPDSGALKEEFLLWKTK